jgi:hypothetical protein
MMKFAFRVIFTRPPFSKWLPTKSSNCVVGHFENGGLVKMILNASFIITNEFLTSKYS